MIYMNKSHLLLIVIVSMMFQFAFSASNTIKEQSTTTGHPTKTTNSQISTSNATNATVGSNKSDQVNNSIRPTQDVLLLLGLSSAIIVVSRFNLCSGWTIKKNHF